MPCGVNFRTPQGEKQSHMMDLLDVNLGEASGSSVQTDPWGIPITAPPPRPQVLANYAVILICMITRNCIVFA